MCRIQRVKRVKTLPPQILEGNWLARGIVDQPIFVTFVNPRAAAYLEWRRPQANNEAISQNTMSHNPHTVRELSCIGGSVLSASVLIAIVDLKIFVTERFQVLRQPIGSRQRLAFVDRAIVSGPTPPSHGNFTRNTSVMKTSNGGTVC